jgi:hypothetical protein
MTPISLCLTPSDIHLLRGCPTGSGQFWTLDQIADELSHRLSRCS